MQELYSAQKRGQYNHNLAIMLSLTEYANLLFCEFSFFSVTTLTSFSIFNRVYLKYLLSLEN